MKPGAYPRLEQLGLIGNCQVSALVADDGTLCWGCLPRFDSEPVFGSLLDAQRGGRFEVGAADGRSGIPSYLANTNILVTEFEDEGGRFRLTDWMPRFEMHGRVFRPTMILRTLEPLAGMPRARVLCDPRLGWSGAEPRRVQGSNHVDFEGFASRLRLTTDIPLAYLGGRPFALTSRRHMALTWGSPVEEPLPALCARFLDETTRYWRRWVKQCNVPPDYQQQVIRSGLCLKLHCFEDTGAVVAATTTSLPEAPQSGRTWDYRHCWLRDSFYVLDALRLLGHFEEREAFLHYLLDIAAASPQLDLSPVHRIDGSSDLEELVVEGWSGYEGHGPVRHGNAAARYKQHDVFGEMALALAPLFLDDRFTTDQNPATLDLLLRLADKAVEVAGTPDAGIWEIRAPWRPQTFSSLMCWAAADRAAHVARRARPGHAAHLEQAAETLRRQILENSWNTSRSSFVADYGGQDVDAALLQMVPLRFLPRDDLRLHATVDAVAKDLTRDGWLLRYATDDGLGRPHTAFVLCSFWLAEALALLGRGDEGRVVLDRALKAASPLGLLAEDFDPAVGRLWGNFPQAYSHVGLIHAAFRVSERWSDVL